MKQTLRDDNILLLKSGKKLGYAEYGNPEGIPILVQHGNPGSRLFWGMLPGSPFNGNYRLIAPDRPGYGLSDHYGKESLRKWPGIVTELMNHLQIENFYNLGVSGGGPYALICAAEIGNKILGTSLVSPVGPFVKESIGDMNVNRKLFALAIKMPWLIRFQFKLTTRIFKKNPENFINLFKKKLKDRDKELLNTLEIQRLLKVDFNEAYRQGEAGSVYDCFIPGNWTINLNSINRKIQIWYGMNDRSIGDMAKYLGKKIPFAETFPMPQMGHFLIFKKVDEIISALVKI